MSAEKAAADGSVLVSLCGISSSFMTPLIQNFAFPLSWRAIESRKGGRPDRVMMTTVMHSRTAVFWLVSLY